MCTVCAFNCTCVLFDGDLVMAIQLCGIHLDNEAWGCGCLPKNRAWQI